MKGENKIKDRISNYEANLISLINNSEDSIWSIDKNYNYIIYNECFKKNYKIAYNVELKAGLNALEILSTELKKLWKTNYDLALKGEKVIFEFYEDILTQRYYFEVHLNSIIDNEIITGVTALSVDITSRKKVELEIAKQEARINSIFRSAPIGIGVVSNRIITEVNYRFCEMTGYSKEELIGKNSVIVYSTEKEFERVGKYKYEQIQKYGTGTIETQFKRKDGKLIDVILSSTPIDIKNMSIGVTFAALDITDRKKIEIESRLIHKRLTTTLEDMNNGFVSLDENWIYTYVNKNAGEMFGRKPEDLVGKHIWTEFPEGVDQPFYKNYYKAVKTQKPIIFEDYYQPWDKWFENRVIPSKDSLAIFFQDITLRKQSEEALLIEKEFSEKIIQTSSAAIVGLDNNHLIRIFNKGIENITGYKKEEVIGKDWFEIFFPAGILDEMDKVWKDAWGISNHSYVNQILTKKGEEKIISWQTTGMYESKVSTEHLIISIGEDITERKKDEKDLIELSSMVQQTTEGMALADLNGDILFSNKAWAKLHGYKNPDEYLGKNLSIFHSKKQFENDVIPFVEEVKKHGRYSGEVGHITVNGKAIPTLMTTTLLKDQQGNPYAMAGIAKDITERKEIVNKLRESQVFNKTLLDMSPDLIYVYDILERKNIYSNQGIMKILGYSIEEIQKMGENVIPDLMHPDDFDNYLKKIIPRYQITKDEEVIEHEYRMKHKNGKWIWLKSKESIFLRLDDGKPKQIFGLTADITYNKQAEKALIHSHDLLSYIVEHNRSAIAIHDKDLNYIYVSKRYLADYKVKEKDIIGKHHYKVFPDIPQKWRDVHQRALMGEILNSEEDIFPREDGTVDWTQWECRPWYEADGSIGGIIVYTEVITERKQAEEEIKEQSKKLKLLNVISTKISRTLSLDEIIEISINQLLENLQPDLVYFFLRENDNLILKMVAPQSEWSRLGDIPEHKVGECMCGLAVAEKRALYSKDIFTDIRCTWNECKEAGFKSFAALPLIIGNEAIGIFGLASNDSRDYEEQSELLETIAIEISLNIHNAMLHEKIIKHADELEIEIENRTKDLSEANIKLQELDKLKSMFIASMSHELRTPLNSIIGFTGLLLQGISGKIDDEARSDLDIVYNSSNHLLGLINDVIDISKVEADKLDTHFEDVILDDVIEEVITAVKSDAEKKKIKISCKIPKGIVIISDRRRLIQCILNLLSNAVKFTIKGTIDINGEKTSDSLKISVTDTGVGIKKKDLPKLFKSFVRLDSPIKEETLGTGLGLYLTKKIVDGVFHGDISADSTYGKGSTFTLDLPLNIEV